MQINRPHKHTYAHTETGLLRVTYLTLNILNERVRGGDGCSLWECESFKKYKF